MTQTSRPRINRTFAGVLAGVSIGMAGIVGVLAVLALLLGQVSSGWEGVRFVLIVGFLVAVCLFNFRFFRARAR
jgi:hypothetical protein